MLCRSLRLFAFFAAASCGPVLLAQPHCSIHTVVGAWAAQSQGNVFPTPPGATAPLTVRGGALGLAMIDYDGRASP